MAKVRGMPLNLGDSEKNAWTVLEYGAESALSFTSA